MLNDVPESPATDPPIVGQLSTRPIWLEMGAVLSISVIPDFISAVVTLCGTRPLYNRLEFHLLHAATSFGIIYVTLYLMSRSGEPWAFFGMDRIRIYDPVIGVMLLVVPRILWTFLHQIGPPPTNLAYADEQATMTLIERVVLIVSHLMNGFAEEIVIKGYMIARLMQITGSPAQTVMLTAILFASYHVYQGSTGFIYQICLGVVMNWAYLAMRRVWPFAIEHALHNLIIEFG